MSNNGDDVLAKELEGLEKSESESMTATKDDIDTTVSQQASPKKKNVKALVAVMVIGAGLVMFKSFNSDSATTSEPIVESSANREAEAPANTSSQTNDILDPDLAAIVQINQSARETPIDQGVSNREVNARPFGEIESGLTPISINQPMNGGLNQPFSFVTTDSVSEEDLELKLASYTTLNRYEADKVSIVETNSEQSIQIQQLMSSVTVLNQKLQRYEQLMESVELDIMLNKTRPEISNLMIVKPRFDCEECVEKASFEWQEADVVVAQNSVFMGFKVMIVGDVLKLISGTVEHVFTPEA